MVKICKMIATSWLNVFIYKELGLGFFDVLILGVFG